MSIHHFGAETQGFQGQVDQNEGVLMPFGKSPEKFPFFRSLPLCILSHGAVLPPSLLQAKVGW